MGHEFHGRFRVDARTWIWILGMIFAVIIIIFQYLELPYDSVVSTIFSSSKVPVAGNSGLLAGGGLMNSEEVGNVNASVTHEVVGAAYSEGNSEETGAHLDVNSASEKNAHLNKSSGTDVNSKPVNNSFADKSAETNNNSTNTDNLGSESVSELDKETGESIPSAYSDNGVKKMSYESGTSEEGNSVSDGKSGFGSSSGSEEDKEHNREPSGEESGELHSDLLVEHTDHSDGKFPEEEVNKARQSHFQDGNTLDGKVSDSNFQEGNLTLTSKSIGRNTDVGSPLLASPQVDSMTTRTFVEHAKTNTSTPDVSITSKTSWEENNPKTSAAKNDQSAKTQENVNIGTDSSASAPELNKSPGTTSSVATIAEMNTWLRESRSWSFSRPPKWSSPADQKLLSVRRQIENAPIAENDPELYGFLYHNVSMFKRSYKLMEETLKIYIYKEGKKPIFHRPYLRGIYASEGWFMKLLEGNKKFVTKDPREAHLFYLPFSSRMLEETLYVAGSHSHKNLIQYLKDYLNLISAKYPFWNRTEGSDHFLVACHDWGPTETKQYMANCIRALCNSDVKEGYVFGKDVSLPETHVRSQQKPLKMLGGRPSSQRSFLAFFAGRMHGYLRPMLVEQWGNNKDPDMKIFSVIPKVKGVNSYVEYMKSSKYCLCPRGYEVNSPRVVEAIFFECVPVVISDNYVPPFLEVLNWESFALFVLEKDVPNLKNILLSIPESRYGEMQMMVKKVQKHFLWHIRPEKYDIFHMILHSIWYNRVFRMKPN